MPNLTNESGAVMINSDAAASDIAKIKSAMQELTDAQDAIARLKNGAADMQGSIPTAIVEQCERLEKQISNLNSHLTAAQNLISQTVWKYTEMDAQLAQKIQGGSV